MASANSLVGLMKWIGREEWHDAFGDLLEKHLAPACRGADIDIEELPSLIGDDGVSALWGCAFEDFLSRDLDDGRNIDGNLERTCSRGPAQCDARVYGAHRLDRWWR